MPIRPAFTSLGAAVLGCLLLAPVAFAANGESTPLNLGDSGSAQAGNAAAGGTGSGLVRTIVGLAIVLGVIYGLYWVLKQVKGSREEQASGQGLHQIATLPLGPGRTLQLVRAGREVVLLGVGEAGVTPIRTYGEAEARALGLLVDELEAGSQDPPRPSSGGLVGRVISALRERTVIK
jgi:flagellar protein FliO/FliZ